MAVSKALRVWIGLVGTTAILSGLQCFINEQYPQNRIYSTQPDQGEPLLAVRNRLQFSLISHAAVVAYVRGMDTIGGIDTAGIRYLAGHWKVEIL